MARIESPDLAGPSGRLEAQLKIPSSREPAGVALVCHPHPLFGGTMHNKVVHAAAEAMAGEGLPVLRFNFRGVGLSEGKHSGGAGEVQDALAALALLEARFPGLPVVVAGYSFGASVGMRAGCGAASVAALIGIGVPVTLDRFDFLSGCAKPITLIQGENDPFGPLPLVMAVAATAAGGSRVVPVPGAAHNFMGRLDELARRVAEAVPGGLRRGA
ncbi:MAG TPA: alpha/beta family hydrolase [Candidatus Polarisedimenticolia bacterium]|nr:alpha/beta family hydrolase [Candidatus Polarisedimenticolia bacterium]